MIFKIYTNNQETDAIIFAAFSGCYVFSHSMFDNVKTFKIRQHLLKYTELGNFTEYCTMKKLIIPVKIEYTHLL